MAGMGGIILYIIFLGALVYFMAIRPQKKERQKQQELLHKVNPGNHKDQQQDNLKVIHYLMADLRR